MRTEKERRRRANQYRKFKRPALIGLQNAIDFFRKIIFINFKMKNDLYGCLFKVVSALIG